jgi:MFS family permease
MANYLRIMRMFSRDVRLFMIASACMGFTYFGIYALLLNLFLLRLGYGPAFIGMINAAGPLAMAVGSLSAGQLSQSWGSRRALVTGFLLTILGFGLLPFAELMADNWRSGWLQIMYMLAWLGATFFVVNIGPFLMDATGDEERNHAFALQSAVLPIAGFAGNLVGGLLPGFFAAKLGLGLDDPAPYRYPLWLAAAMLLPALIAVNATRVTSSRPRREQTVDTTPAPVLLIVVLALVMFLRAGGEWTMRIFFNIYLDTSLHVPTALIGALLAAGQLLGVAALVSPLVMMRWGKPRVIGWGNVGMAIAYIPLLLISHWGAVGIGFMLMSTLVALTAPTFGVFSQESVPPRWRTTVAGATMTALGVGIALVAFGGGYLVAAVGFRPLFLVGGGLNLAAALLFFAFVGRRRRRVIEAPGPKSVVDV